MRYMSWRTLVKRHISAQIKIIKNGIDILSQLPTALSIIPEEEENNDILITVSYLLDKEEITSYGILLEPEERETIHQKILDSIEETRDLYQKRKGLEKPAVVALAVAVYNRNDSKKNQTCLLVNARFYREREWL